MTNPTTDLYYAVVYLVRRYFSYSYGPGKVGRIEGSRILEYMPSP